MGSQEKYDGLIVISKISIIRKGMARQGTLGKGVVSLLEGIEDLGSLNKAAKQLGMAYSKAWRILKETEAGFGFPVIYRDGARGSTLTPEGRHLLRIYQDIQTETNEYANRRFREEVAKIGESDEED